MATFKFRLQTLMRLRIAERDERRAKLSEAYRAEQILRGRVAEVVDEIQALKQAARGAVSPGEIQVDSLLQTHRYEIVLLAQKQQLEQQVAQIVEEVERRRLALVEADRQVRVLEKLRDKRFAEHQHQELKVETKLFDEIAQRVTSTRERNRRLNTEN